MRHLWSLGHGCGSWKSKSWSHWSSNQGVGEAVVLVEVLVLEGHVAVVDGHGQLTLAEQPLKHGDKSRHYNTQNDLTCLAK